MTILENLNFRPAAFSDRYLSWKNIYNIYNRLPDDKNRLGRTVISKKSNISFTGDKRENILFQGSYAFDNDEFANNLLKNIGILEKINGTKLLEQKGINHRQVLIDFGFKEIAYCTWTKNIFLISLRPPRFETDRGKCIILKKPNIKKLTLLDGRAKVVYKGRYFFDDTYFTETLLEKIGVYHFDNGKKNKTYEFNRETLADNDKYIEDEFLKF